MGWLWIRGRASILLSEGCWFDSPVCVSDCIPTLRTGTIGTDIKDITRHHCVIIVLFDPLTCSKYSENPYLV